ncbi:L-cystine transmembrane transporter [Aureococcus anophagefferens]|nr:L-cystine transmembrane transporter [Aureococcus anophagefferens]
MPSVVLVYESHVSKIAYPFGAARARLWAKRPACLKPKDDAPKEHGHFFKVSFAPFIFKHKKKLVALHVALFGVAVAFASMLEPTPFKSYTLLPEDSNFYQLNAINEEWKPLSANPLMVHVVFGQPGSTRLRARVAGRGLEPDVWDDLAGVGRGPLFGAAWSVMSPRLTESMRRLFRTRCDEAMKVCDDRLAETLDRANGFLEKSGGEFLGGDAPSISDVAMATLAAPLVLPAKFARGKYASPFEQLLAQDAEMQAQVEAYRATPVGAHALKVYEHR